MTTASEALPTRRVIIGGQEYDKPWDPACAACRSPWLGSIDAALAEGRSMKSIRRLLAGRHPAVPSEQLLREHIAHLAGPHLKMRMDFEDAAEARGESTDTASARMEDALAALIRQGTELLAHGELDITAQHMLAAMKLQAQLTAQRDGEGVEASQWEAVFMELIEIVRRHLGHAQWKAFMDDVYSSAAIRAVLDGQQALPGRTA